MSDKEIVIHKLICTPDRCTCARKGGKFLGQIWCHAGDSLVLQTACPNAKSCPIYFHFGPNPPDPK